MRSHGILPFIADVNTTSANDTKKDGEPALFESGDCNKAFKADIAGGLAAVAAGSCIGSDVADVECKNSSQTQKREGHERRNVFDSANGLMVLFVLAARDCVIKWGRNDCDVDSSAFGMDPNTPANLGMGLRYFVNTTSIFVVNTTSANDTKKDGEPALFESGDCGPSHVYLKVVNGHLLKLGEAEQAVVERATTQFIPQALAVARVRLEKVCVTARERMERKSSGPSADIAKITRKWSKPDKHEHGNGRAYKKLGECYQVNLQSTWSTKVKVKIMGLLPIEGYKGQFKGQSTHGQSYTSSNAPYWPIPCEE
ncbi:hypothetical protein Tco_1270239 [Tanacetum coccineum]